MPNEIWLSQLQKHRAIAVIRAPKIEVGEEMAMAVASGECSRLRLPGIAIALEN